MNLNFINIPFFHSFVSTKFQLSEEAKLAAIIGLFEENRKKKRLFRGEEQIKYVTRFEYPLDIHPWNNKSLLLKHFFTEDDILNYGLTIDIHKFIGEVRRTATNVKDYTKMLDENIDLFKNFKKNEDISFGFLLNNNDFSKLLISEVQNNKILDKSSHGIIISSPEYKNGEKKIEYFDELWKKSQKDLDNLIHIADIIKIELEKIGIKNEEETNLIEDQSNKEIEKYMPSLKKLIKKIEKEKYETINKIEKPIKRELSYLSKTKNKCENELRRYKQQESRFKREKERRNEKQDKHGEQFWGKELQKCKKEISLIENKILRFENDIDKLKNQLSSQINEITDQYSEMINVEWLKITEIKNIKDNVIKKIRINYVLLEDITIKMTQDIVKQVEQKKLEIMKLKKYIVPWDSKKKLLIYIPFYLAQYWSNNQIRYDIISPIQIDMDRTKISVRSRRLIGLNDNLSNTLKPFSKDILDMINRDVIIRIKNDANFAMNIEENAIKHNVIAKEDFSNIIKDGFKELVEKSLINQNEASAILIQENKWSKYQIE